MTRVCTGNYTAGITHVLTFPYHPMHTVTCLIPHTTNCPVPRIHGYPPVRALAFPVCVLWYHLTSRAHMTCVCVPPFPTFVLSCIWRVRVPVLYMWHASPLSPTALPQLPGHVSPTLCVPSLIRGGRCVCAVLSEVLHHHNLW